MSGDDNNPWTALIQAAQIQIRSANEGNKLAALEVLAQAAVGLRDVLAGRLPDPERSEYLKYLLGALEQVAQDAPPDKALGLWSNNRPSTVPPDRDLVLFMTVGFELDRLRSTSPGIESPVAIAIDNVAAQFKIRKFRVGRETVRNAWNTICGTAAWDAAKTAS